MAVPTYDAMMRAFLDAISDGKDHRTRDVATCIADFFGLTAGDRELLLPSGQQTMLANRVAWARTYLKKAGLVDSTARGIVRLTQEGQKVLKANPREINDKFLRRYPAYVEFTKKPREAASGPSETQSTTPTPDDAIEAAYQELRAALIDELLDRLRSCSPQFFERLVIELLVAMGYGGSLADAGKAVGRSGDGGIDGIIKEDRLGLDVVCIQAKRWQNTVGSSVVREFAGSMAGHRARKGVLLTTATFSRDAREYVDRIEQKIVLIDGDELAQLMIDHGIGVTRARQYEIKRIDSDYFDE